jgi:hypothetical protein
MSTTTRALPAPMVLPPKTIASAAATSIAAAVSSVEKAT